MKASSPYGIRRSLLPGLAAVIVLAAGAGSFHWYAGAAKSALKSAPGQFQEFLTVNLDDGRSLNVGRFEVSFEQWGVCAAEGHCRKLVMSSRVAPDYPVTKVSWFDTQDYISWINRKTGKSLRLPKLAEWEAIAADHMPKPKKKLFTDPRMAWAADYDITAGPRVKTTKSGGSFGYNRFGLADVKGNVWEWTSTECGTDETSQLPNCRAGRVVMGEHLAVLSDLVRDPGNASCGVGLPPANLGFRLVFDG